MNMRINETRRNEFPIGVDRNIYFAGKLLADERYLVALYQYATILDQSMVTIRKADDPPAPYQRSHENSVT
jgi:hypothetical protein